jgi:hypothetical protein
MSTRACTLAVPCCLVLLAACTDAQPESQSAASSRRTGVVADQFQVGQSLAGDTLTLWVETDLPDATELMVSVARGWYPAGDTRDYSHPYFEESSTVGKWRAPRRVVLDESGWRNGLDEKQRILARAGDPFTVRDIGDSVEISFVVPVNQDDPRFGSRNEHLTGRAVAVGDLGWPIIHRDVRLDRPIGELETGASKWASWSDLRVGRRYRLTREVPLMPEFEPADPMAAIARIREIPADGEIVILQQRDRRGTLWFEATAYSPAGVRIGDGWINSTALLGQDIKIVR